LRLTDATSAPFCDDSREKIRPEAELAAARRRILDAKARTQLAGVISQLR
jgi:hypothetical protein